MGKFHVLGSIGLTGRPWWLNGPDGGVTSGEATRLINWQRRGGSSGHEYLVCTYDREANAFRAARFNGRTYEPDPNGATFQPDRGPYTREAFARMAAAIGYRPPIAADGWTLRNTIGAVICGPAYVGDVIPMPGGRPAVQLIGGRPPRGPGDTGGAQIADSVTCGGLEARPAAVGLVWIRDDTGEPATEGEAAPAVGDYRFT